MLDMWAIGHYALPVTFSEANLNIRSLSWRQDIEDYRNAEWLKFGPDDVVEVTDHFDGTGAQTSYPLNYAINQGTAPPTATVTRGGSPFVYPVGVNGVDTMGWTYDASQNRIVDDTAQDPPILGVSDDLDVTYVPGFPQFLYVEDATLRANDGLWVIPETLDNVTSKASAQSYGDARIDQNSTKPKRLSLVTHSGAGCDPGEQGTIEVARLDVASASYLLEYISVGIVNSPAPLDAPVGFDNVMWRREPSLGEYKENRVRWSRALLRKMKAWREEMRLAAVAGAYDYLFMVDSDLILASDTLRLLIAENKDFISGVVWTRWRPWRNWRWVNEFDIVDNKCTNISYQFRRALHRVGVHRVGMTGACSLISKNILNLISYAPLVGQEGEDMCMAVRARDAGIPLYAHAGVKIEHRRRR